MPVALFSTSTSRVASVFLGLFAASILPTVSILLQSLSSSTRSVKRVDDLHTEIASAIDTLFRILGTSGIATLAFLLNSISTPKIISFLNIYDALERIGNGVAAGCIAYLILEAGRIPAIIRASLRVRYEVAKEEARQRTRDNAPSEMEIKSSFSTKEGFGRVKSLDRPA